jgi:Family of unknown function (DUF6232)
MGRPETAPRGAVVSYERELITVRVSRRVLWIGAQAYPLQNIARAQTIKLVSNRRAAIRHYVMAVIFWVILGIAAALFLGDIALIIMLALIGISTIRLKRALSRPAFYALEIETAGNPSTVLVSTNENQVTQIVHLIMDAIDNPHADFQLQVENFHVGDRIQQFGNKNVGKVSR